MMKKPDDLIKNWIIHSLATGDKKVSEIINEYKDKYLQVFGEHLIYQHIYKNLETLVNIGVVKKISDEPKTYRLQEGCFNGRLIYKITKSRVLHHFCGNPLMCKCKFKDEEKAIRIVTEECVYYDLLMDLKPRFRIRL